MVNNDGTVRRAGSRIWQVGKGPGRSIGRLAGFLFMILLSCSRTSSPVSRSDGDAHLKGPDANDANLSCGTSACEQRTWPRLVITLSPAGTASAALGVSGREGDGIVWDALADGCPIPTSFDCTYVFFGNDITRRIPTIHLIISKAGQSLGERDIPLRPFNYCGIDVAHVVVEVGDGGSIKIGDPQYVSPCRSL